MDESTQKTHIRGIGLYVMAAAIYPVDDSLELHRQELRAASAFEQAPEDRRGFAHFWHSTEATPNQRHNFARAVADTNPNLLVAAHMSYDRLDPESEYRARDIVLRYIMHKAYEKTGATLFVTDKIKGSPQREHADRNILTDLRKTVVELKHATLQHMSMSEEHLMWAADSLAHATQASLTRGSSPSRGVPFQILEPKISLYSVMDTRRNSVTGVNIISRETQKEPVLKQVPQGVDSLASAGIQQSPRDGTPPKALSSGQVRPSTGAKSTLPATTTQDTPPRQFLPTGEQANALLDHKSGVASMSPELREEFAAARKAAYPVPTRQRTPNTEFQHSKSNVPIRAQGTSKSQSQGPGLV